MPKIQKRKQPSILALFNERNLMLLLSIILLISVAILLFQKNSRKTELGEPLTIKSQKDK